MKLAKRMLPLLITSLVIIAGMFFFILRYVTEGEEWALSPWNDTAYENGEVSVGTIYDRNGLLLAASSDGKRIWSDDSSVRKAMLHSVGDGWGNISTGALSVFEKELTGFDVFSGMFSWRGNGGEIQLSLDARISDAACAALDDRNGTVLVENYETGEILCMVSSPSFDPMHAEDGIPEGSFINRGMQATYAPGSVFKIVTTIAALEELQDVRGETFECEGSCIVGDNAVNCSGYHGRQRIEDAFANSCNCAYSQVAQELGGTKIARYFSALGLDAEYDICGESVSTGHFDIYPYDSVDLSWSGIGQSTDLVCPMSFLRLVSAIANGGEAVPQTFLKYTGGPVETERIISGSSAWTVGGMMQYAVEHTYGQENFRGLDICAKSGTAEIDGEEPHAWFTGYIKNPGFPLAFVVVIENGGSGASNAGEVANRVMQSAVYGY